MCLYHTTRKRDQHTKHSLTHAYAHTRDIQELAPLEVGLDSEHKHRGVVQFIFLVAFHVLLRIPVVASRATEIVVHKHAARNGNAIVVVDLALELQCQMTEEHLLVGVGGHLEVREAVVRLAQLSATLAGNHSTALEAHVGRGQDEANGHGDVVATQPEEEVRAICDVHGIQEVRDGTAAVVTRLVRG